MRTFSCFAHAGLTPSRQAGAVWRTRLAAVALGVLAAVTMAWVVQSVGESADRTAPDRVRLAPGADADPHSIEVHPPPVRLSPSTVTTSIAPPPPPPPSPPPPPPTAAPPAPPPIADHDDDDDGEDEDDDDDDDDEVDD